MALVSMVPEVFGNKSPPLRTLNIFYNHIYSIHFISKQSSCYICNRDNKYVILLNPTVFHSTLKLRSNQENDQGSMIDSKSSLVKVVMLVCFKNKDFHWAVGGACL